MLDAVKPVSSLRSRQKIFRLVAALLLGGLCTDLSGQSLTRIRRTGTLRCATIVETPEYSSTDDHGPRTEFDASLCRAVAVAILGPSARIDIKPYPDDVAATSALHSAKVDLIPTLTLDFTHASDSRITFSPPVLYDGIGFLVPSGAGPGSPNELAGNKVCLLSESDVEPALRAWFTRNGLDFVPFPFNEEGEMEAAFVSGNCVALAGDLTRLVNTRLAFGPLAGKYALLTSGKNDDPLQIAEDPLASASASSDPAFANIVRWTVEVLLNAEAAHFDQRAATALDPPVEKVFAGRETRSLQQPVTRAQTQPADPVFAALAGDTRELGNGLKLNPRWAAHVVAAVGNYAELFEQTLGAHSPLQLPRAQNRLSSDGGLQVPLPLK